MLSDEFDQPVQPPLELLRGVRRRFAHRRGPQIHRELRQQVGGQPTRSLGARQSRHRGEQRPIMPCLIGHLVVETLVVLRLDGTGTEADPIADHQSRAGLVVEVGEHGGGHGDGKPRSAAEFGESGLGLHLGAADIADRVVEVPGELREQVGVRMGMLARVAHRQHGFTSGAAAGHLVEAIDGDDLVAVGQRPVGAQGFGEETGSGLAQRVGVGGEREAGRVTAHPVDLHHVCSAARTRISLTATRRSRVTMYVTASAMSSGLSLTIPAVRDC
nr:hypothetical protein CPGR_01639 [Mycolicibacterium malmesburyense]